MEPWERAHGVVGLPTVTTSRADPHDASCEAPPSLGAAGVDWPAFGAIDQRRAIALVREFGTWSDDALAARVDAMRAEVAPAASRLVEGAYDEHLANRGAAHTDGCLHFRHIRASADERTLAAAERLMSWLALLAQWDLYHLVGAPDVAVFHGGPTTLADRRRNIARGYRLYAGYSWTPDVSVAHSGYGSVLYATALPVRHVQLSWRVPFVRAAVEQAAHRELAPRDGLVLAPANSFAFDVEAANDEVRAAADEFRDAPARPGTALGALRAAVEAA